MPTITFEQIGSVTASGSQSNLTFSNIPQTYRHLYLSYSAKGSTSNEDMLVRFNGSTSSSLYNFSQANENANSTVSVGHYNLGDVTGMRIGDYMQTTAQSSDWGGGEVWILDYTATNHFKTYMCHGMNAVGANQRWVGFHASTSAVTQLDFYLGGTGNFVSGSKFTLYGLVG